MLAFGVPHIFATKLFRNLADPSEALTLERLLNQGIDSGNVADQFLWESVADPQIVGAGRTDPDLIILTLPDQHFEGQLKREERRSNHEGCASFRTAKDQHLGLLHRDPDPSRFSTVVNMGKEDQISVVYGCLQASQRLLHRERAGSAHNALDRGRRSLSRWLVHGSHLFPVLARELVSLTPHHHILPALYHSHLLSARLQRSHSASLFSRVVCAKTVRRVSVTWASAARAGAAPAIGLSS